MPGLCVAPGFGLWVVAGVGGGEGVGVGVAVAGAGAGEVMDAGEGDGGGDAGGVVCAWAKENNKTSANIFMNSRKAPNSLICFLPIGNSRRKEERKEAGSCPSVTGRRA